MGRVKRLALDRYEHGLLVRALYKEWHSRNALICESSIGVISLRLTFGSLQAEEGLFCITPVFTAWSKA